MDSISNISMDFNKKVKINFNGGDLTSDSGLLLVKEFDDKIGFSKLLKDSLHIKGNLNARKHLDVENIIQKIYQNIAGYNTDAISSDLMHEHCMKTIFNKESLASQPTMSRTFGRISKKNIHELNEFNLAFLDKAYDIELPEEIIFDVDSSNIDTFGNQHGNSFNGHYMKQGFHPLFLFDGIKGDFIKTELRSGNVYTSRNVVRFMGPVIKRYRSKYPTTKLSLRGDSGFANPELFNLCEEHNVNYVIRLKSNKALTAKVSGLIDEVCKDIHANAFDNYEYTTELTYKATSWPKPRRVIVKINNIYGTLKYNIMFLVTNDENISIENAVEHYKQRGTMENYIKEYKNGFFAKNLSSTEYITNVFRLLLSGLSYNLINFMRRLCFSKSIAKYRIDTIRNKLIKIAGKISTSGRQIFYNLCSNTPYKNMFIECLHNIQTLPYG